MELVQHLQSNDGGEAQFAVTSHVVNPVTYLLSHMASTSASFACQAEQYFHLPSCEAQPFSISRTGLRESLRTEA